MTEGMRGEPMLSDDDSISLTSSKAEAIDEDAEFEVEKILAERRIGRKRIFLIKWKDYKLEESSWEPESNLSHELLAEWKKQLEREGDDSEESFDVEEFNNLQVELLKKKDEEKVDRHRRRKAKRMRLGLPTSPMKGAETKRAVEGDSNSDEAVENNEFEDRSGDGVISKPNPRQSVQNAMTGTGNESSADTNIRNPQGSSSEIEPILGGRRRSIQLNRSEKEVISEHRERMERTQQGLDSSSPDIPLSKKRPLQRRESSSSLDEPLAQRLKKASLAQEVTSIPAKVAPATDSLHQVRTSSKSRGSTSARGGSTTGRGTRAVRGGSSHKNVFETRDVKKKRPNLLQNATDFAKAPKTFANMRLLRRAELQSRDRAEAEPDVNALGGLFDPSRQSMYQSLKPATLRKSSSSSITQQVQDTTISVPNSRPLSLNDEASSNAHEDPESPEAQPVWEPSLPHSQMRPEICYYWNKEQTEQGKPCRNGTYCQYYHRRVPSMNVAQAPPAETTARPMICFFWNLAQKDKRYPQCSKGSECAFIHGGEDGVEVAPAPRNFKYLSALELGSSSQETSIAASKEQDYSLVQSTDSFLEQSDQSMFQCPSIHTESVPNHHQLTHSRPPWNPRNPHNAICYFWDKDGYCTKKEKCKYYHNNDIRLPVAPSPREQREGKFVECTPCIHEAKKGRCPKGNSCNYYHANETPNNFQSTSLETSSLSILEQLASPPEATLANFQIPSGRPYWDMNNGTYAICYSWAQGACHWGSGCKYFHCYDKHLPLGPPPGSLKQWRPCTYWLNGGCNKSADECIFRHGPPPSPRNLFPSIASHRLRSTTLDQPASHELLSVSADADQLSPDKEDISRPAMANPTKGVKKSVKFLAVDDTSSFNHEAGDLQSMSFGETSDTAMTEHDAHSSNRDSSDAVAGLDCRDGRPSCATELPASEHPLASIPKTRMNMDVYLRKKSLEELRDRVKEVKFGTDDAQPLILDFGDFNSAQVGPWKNDFAAMTQIIFNKCCMAQDFQAQQPHLQQYSIWQGSLSPASGNSESVKIIEKIVEEMVVKCVGLFASFTDFNILVFPAMREEWKFIDKPNEYLNTVQLRYHIFRSNYGSQIPLEKSRITATRGKYRELLTKEIHGLDFKNLLPIRVDKTKPYNPYNFYLLFPPTGSKTEVFLTSWIQASSSDSKIYTSKLSHSWESFLRNPDKYGVVLVHEAIAPYLHQLPSLWRILVGGVNFCFWRVSENISAHTLIPSVDPFDNSRMAKVTTTRLFPQGCALFLTPSFLVAEPERTLDILTWFLGDRRGKRAKYSLSTPGTWKLVCCRNFSNYMLDLANSKATEKEKLEAKYHSDPGKDAKLQDRRLSYATCLLRYQIHELLVAFEDRLFKRATEHGGVFSDSGDSDDFENPLVVAPRRINPDDEQALVHWFASWSMLKLDIYRKFVVVGTDPSNKKFASRLRYFGLSTKVDPKEAYQGSFSLSRKSSVDPGSSTKSTVQISAQKRKALDIAAKLTAASPYQQLIKRPNASPKSFNSVASKSPAETSRNDIETDLLTMIQEESRKSSVTQDSPQHSESNSNILTGTNIVASPLPATPANLTDQQKSLLQFEGPSDTFSPQFDGSDERPSSSMSTSSSNTSRAGIATDGNENRIAPRSVRPDNTIRKEKNIGPGFIPREGDLGKYKVRRTVGGDSGSSRESSRRGSLVEVGAAKSSPLASGMKDVDMMDIDNDFDIDSPVIVGCSTSNEEKGTGKTRMVELKENVVKTKWITYEPTTKWYQRHRAQGNGWEHIMIESWDQTSKFLGLRK